MKKVYGSYLNIEDARKAISELLEEGYTRKNMRLISNEEFDEDLNYRDTDIETDDESLWERVKDLFIPDEKYDESYVERDLSKNERNELMRYKSNIQAGEIIILLEEKSEQNYEEKLINVSKDAVVEEELKNEGIEV